MLVGLSLQFISNNKKKRSWAKRRIPKHKTYLFRPIRVLGITAIKQRKHKYAWYKHRWLMNYVFMIIKYNYCNITSPILGYRFQKQGWWLLYPKYKEWRY